MEELYPLFVYIYDEKGYYGDPVRVDNEAELKAQMEGSIAKALKNKCEVRVTDINDYLVFHSECGVIVFPPPTDPIGGELICFEMRTVTL